MKKRLRMCNLFLLTGILFMHNADAEKHWISINSSVPAAVKTELVSSDIQRSVLTFSIPGFYKQEVITPNGAAYVISAIGATPLLNAGSPDLPKVAASVIIPDQGEMKAEIISSSYRDFPNIEIAPSKGNLIRTVNPSEISYKYGDAYSQNAFYPAGLTSLRKPYILRDLRGQTVIVNPFQYNPVTKTLRVYTSITVSVTADKSIGENPLRRTAPLNKVNREFASLYGEHFKNFNSVQYVPSPDEGSLLVICPTQWMSILQPLVDWKIQKGTPTEMVDVITAGGNAVNIKDFISNYYSTHNLTHVLLVGDDAQVPSPSLSGGASDPSYGYILGNDSYAEVFIGRFSGQTSTDIQTQVDRTLNYEKYPDPVGTWYSKAVVVASNQGPGDDNEMDWEHEVNIRTDYLGYTYTNVTELYDGTHPATTDAAGDPLPVDLFNVLQSGVSIMSYTGHGSTTSFGTTGFSNSEVQALTNTSQLPFIWSVGCVNGDFLQTSGPCIGEAFLNAQYNGQPTGAIATLMSSINQSWDPPMDAQDEMVDILVESYANNIKRTYGGISVNGCMHMNDQYGLAGDEMTDTWICFGDPSLNVRTATPQTINVTHAATTPLGTSSFLVNCNQNGALVALTMNGSIISTGIVTGGIAQLFFPALSVIDTMTVTVTGFNLVPYYSHVLILPASGPYVIYQSDNSSDISGNINGVIEYNETVNVDVTLLNAGLSDASNLTVSLSTADPYINILNGNTTLANLLASANATLTNAFQYLISPNIPDQHVIQFDLTITDGANTWTSVFSQTVNAPALAIHQLTINDAVGGNGNGILEPGETGDLIIECVNSGHSDISSANAAISTTSPFVTINNSSYNAGSLNQGSQVNAIFTISLAGNLMFGTLYDVSCQLIAGSYFASKLFYQTAGENIEDFETNNFSKYAWGMMGNQDWFTTNYQPYQGTYCAESGNINDNETSGLRLNINVLTDDSISFWYKVSSEQNYDFLYFSLDMSHVQGWSGSVPWTRAAYPISPGQHIVMFSYEKDGLVSVGMDCGWLDNIKLPPGTAITAINTIPADENGVVCFPNPAKGYFNILFDSDNLKPTELELADINGKILKQINISSQQSLSNYTINTGDLSSGLYFLKITGSEKIIFKKILVQ